jgi:hypothetical protein
MARTLIVGSQETGRTGILPVWGVHRQDAYAPSDVHLLVAPEYAHLSALCCVRRYVASSRPGPILQGSLPQGRNIT